MAMLVALDVMSLFWMAVVAVLACAQKLLPAKAAIDVPLALALVGLGLVIVFAPVAGSGAHAASDADVTTRNKEGRQAMTSHKTGTREEWLAARLELLEAEKELTRRGDELSRRRQELPWVRVDKDYRFETDEGTASLADLFRGTLAAARLPLHVRPRLHRRMPVLLGDRRRLQRLRGPPRQPRRHALRGLAGPVAKLSAYRQRMGWSFPWASSYGSDFNFDFGVAHTKEEWEAGTVAYNFGEQDLRPAAGDSRAPSTHSPSRSSARTGRPTGVKGPA